MDKAKQKRLEAAGWKVGTVQDFLDLSPEEALLIDIRARLALALSERRKAQSLTQAELARRIRSSQSRVAKMEAADGSVSLDLLVRSLLALGTTRKELAAAIAGK
ncbi:MAG TPA: XRE family transcriptional regulator [Pseudomonadota bacterium]|nr:XRE family transcriptional regulator [Pseudomonadota bacterium]HNK47019.1 XRE family transcriptional regulator [Pseudomonadota bacterium]HNN54668.1 XRE family transcriptional regulator [Pseudomonadota bacterium]HNO68947.1 XRE family transcriptional regulator [Pseudomonadota bacterium]